MSKKTKLPKIYAKVGCCSKNCRFNIHEKYLITKLYRKLNNIGYTFELNQGKNYCLQFGCATLGSYRTRLNYWKFVYGNNHLVPDEVLKSLVVRYN